MSLSTWLDQSFSAPTSINGKSDYYSPSWKGNKSSQTTLSALTLLAFLFFLNILQSCLRDQFQTPLTILMNTTAVPANNNNRAKRETKIIGESTTKMKSEILNSLTSEEVGETDQGSDNPRLNEKYLKKSTAPDTVNEDDKGSWLNNLLCCEYVKCEVDRRKILNNKEYGPYVRYVIEIACGDSLDQRKYETCGDMLTECEKRHGSVIYTRWIQTIVHDILEK